jgi:NAD(P)-dependent dehydrogenase (short-subunit alcohol dehydrogenase family)
MPGARGAVVTGGARGIGRAVAERLVADGYGVVLLDVDADELAGTAAAIGERAIAHPGDAADRDDLRAAIAKSEEAFGGLDAFVAVAGIAAVAPLLDITDDDWARVLELNLTGVFRGTQEAGRVMAAGRGGAIVVIASTNAFWVEQNLAAYNTSKGGVVAFVRSAGMDLAGLGVRVNGVAPGVVRTRIAEWVIDDPELGPEYLRKIPQGRFAEPEDVAAAVAWLLSDQSSYMTGQTLVLDGGQTLGIPLEERSLELPGGSA